MSRKAKLSPLLAIRRSLLVALMLTLFSGVLMASGENEVTWWSGAGPSEAYEAVIALFEEETGIKVNFRAGWAAELTEQFILAYAVGDAPDLLTVYRRHQNQLYEAGVLVPLDPYMESSGFWDKIMPGIKPEVENHGVAYGVPGVLIHAADGLLYDRRAFDEAGVALLDPDRVYSLDELSNINRSFVVRDGEGRLLRTGFTPLEGVNTHIDVWERYYDAFPFDANGAPNLLSQEYIDILRFYNDNFIQLIGADDVKQLTGGGYLPNAMAQGLTVFANYGSHMPTHLRSANPDLDLAVTWPPTTSGEKRMGIAVWRSVIPDSANVENAWKLAEFLATNYEAQVLLHEGLGSVGPSREFFELYRSDDPTMQWYMQAMAHAVALRDRTGLPDGNEVLRAAALKVYLQEAAPQVALQLANDELYAEILRLQGK